VLSTGGRAAVRGLPKLRWIMKIIGTITIPGEPVAKGRPRVVRRGNHTRAITPPKTVAYESMVALVASEAWQGEPIAPDVPVAVIIDAYFKRPKRLMRRKDPTGAIPHTKRPDGDNVAKAVLDGLDKAGIWHDDSQVTNLTIRKWYCAMVHRTEPRTVIRIEVEP